MKEKTQGALKLACLEFVVVFLSELGWGLFRKGAPSVLDAFGIALLTALLLLIFHASKT